MPGGEWLSPDDRWDSHSRALAEKALARARKERWWLKKASGHAHIFGVLTCGDPALPGTERCTVSVSSTSGRPDGSSTAKVIEAALRKCVHEHADTSGAADALAVATALVTSARHCVSAAEHLLASEGHRELVEDYLRQAEAAADEADLLFQDALEAELTADRSAAAATGAMQMAEYDGPQDPRALATRAGDLASEADAMVRGDSDRAARTLRADCDDVRQRARTLLTRL